MLRKFRASLTYANVVSTLCLFVVLGGTSYGVVTGAIDSREIKNNTVRSKDVRNNSLRGKDVRAGTLRNSDLGVDAIEGDRVLESSLGTVPRASTATTASRATSATSAGNAATLQGKTAAAFVPAGKVLGSGRVIEFTATGFTSVNPNRRTIVQKGGLSVEMTCYTPSVPGVSGGLGFRTNEPGTRYHVLDNSLNTTNFFNPPQVGVTNSNSSAPSSLIYNVSLEAPSGAALHGVVVLGMNQFGADCTASGYAIG